MDMHLRIGESPSICPFLKNNGDEAPKGPSPIIFRNGQIRGLKIHLNRLKINLNQNIMYLIDIDRFLFAHGDKNVLCLHVVYSTVHSLEIMDSLIMAK